MEMNWLGSEVELMPRLLDVGERAQQRGAGRGMEGRDGTVRALQDTKRSSTQQVKKFIVLLKLLVLALGIRQRT